MYCSELQAFRLCPEGHCSCVSPLDCSEDTFPIRGTRAGVAWVGMGWEGQSHGKCESFLMWVSFKWKFKNFRGIHDDFIFLGSNFVIWNLFSHLLFAAPCTRRLHFVPGFHPAHSEGNSPCLVR